MDHVTIVAIAALAIVLSVLSAHVGVGIIVGTEPVRLRSALSVGSSAHGATHVDGRGASPNHRQQRRRVHAVRTVTVVVAAIAAVGAVAVTIWASARGGATFGDVLAHASFAGLSVVLAVVDWRCHRLSNPLILLAAVGVIGGFACALAGGASPQRFLHALLVGCVVFAIGALLYLVTRAAIGGGDVKLSGVLGVLLGWWGLDVVLTWVLLSAVFGGLLALVAMRRNGRSAAVPFGPALLAGAWAAILLAA